MKDVKLVMLIASVLLLVSCGEPQQSADDLMQKQTAQQMQEANRQIGMPGIRNFQERKLMKMILELRDDENLICYAYLYDRDKGEVGQYLGECLGFGLPYSVQYTNPMKSVSYHQKGAYGYYTIPQADPNGLFMPTGLSATWLMLLDNDGKPHPVYVEPEIIVSPFKLNINNELKSN